MPPLALPFATATFTFNAAGVAGLLGSEDAVAAMATVPLYEGRRYLGWYNSTGSYAIAKHFGRIGNSRFWAALFPGSSVSPAVSFQLDGKKGPEYTAALSGTSMRTGHLGHLTMELVKELVPVVISGRTTRPVDVAYLAMRHVDHKQPIKRLPFEGSLHALIPIAVSILTCIMCALVYDWLSFCMILLGIVSSGLATYVIGGGKLVLKAVDRPALGSPPGHGVLLTQDLILVIKGKERDVNTITRGRFDLETDRMYLGEDKGISHYHTIGASSLLLFLQFLLQLLLIPLGTLFGQIMFLVSLGVSWAYNSYLFSLEKEKIQMTLLFEKLGHPNILRFRVGTRSTSAVFTCLLLFHEAEVSPYEDDREANIDNVLRSLIQNDTRVWKCWKIRVVKQILNIDYETRSLPYLVADEVEGELADDGDGILRLSDQDRNLLDYLLKDARNAFETYFAYHELLPRDSTQD